MQVNVYYKFCNDITNLKTFGFYVLPTNTHTHTHTQNHTHIRTYSDKYFIRKIEFEFVAFFFVQILVVSSGHK